jgi:hypothetical protein
MTFGQKKKNQTNAAQAKIACPEGKLLSGRWSISGLMEETVSGLGLNGNHLLIIIYSTKLNKIV